jgi:hypothetical protein
MIIKTHKTYTEFEADLPSGGRPVSVTVFHGDSPFTHEFEAKVNWSALGSVSPEDAATYANLLQEAAMWAAERQEEGCVNHG